MTLKITEGDIVTLYFEDGGTVTNVKVLNMPRGPGDLLQLEYDGDVIAINPYSPHFRQLTKEMQSS